MAGAHNDINVLQRSPVFTRLTEGHAPVVNFEINGHPAPKRTTSPMVYVHLGLYLRRQFPTVLQAHFAKCQEACQKDVEQAFRVLSVLLLLGTFLFLGRNLGCGE
jgi:hypothetical protein